MTAPKIEAEQTDRGFRLKNVRIGIGFHWDRCEDQEFEGKLSIIRNADGTETAVNTLDLEQYLTSVISSEMSADSPVELLKAHAVISRSWAIRAIEANRVTRGTIVSRLYEQNGHVGFDVCADDHCQRYEGLGRRNERAIEAVRETAGEVLTYTINHKPYTINQICDARFSKCCGGKTEEFETCWEDIHVPYLESVECPYCGRVKDEVLKAVLNGYDQETHDFHDWTVRYTADELCEILREKTGVDYGRIVDLRPLLRGKSGRIYSLEIVGEKETRVIGKELVIRRALSRSCLYSSWFDVEKKEAPREGAETIFVLRGHGWGHGVGLCQIGAAEMAAEGKTYREILAHYYPGTSLSTRITAN